MRKLYGQCGLQKREKSAASGTNCRSAVVLQSQESHQFIGFFTMAQRLLIPREPHLFGA
jgi:hypothetical protein